MDFQNIFPWLTSHKVYVPFCKLSNIMIKCGLNNGQAKSSIVNMSIPLEPKDKGSKKLVEFLVALLKLP